jgi:hypothetical protein
MSREIAMAFAMVLALFPSWFLVYCRLFCTESPKLSSPPFLLLVFLSILIFITIQFDSIALSLVSTALPAQVQLQPLGRQRRRSAKQHWATCVWHTNTVITAFLHTYLLRNQSKNLFQGLSAGGTVGWMRTADGEISYTCSFNSISISPCLAVLHTSTTTTRITDYPEFPIIRQILICLPIFRVTGCHW